MSDTDTRQGLRAGRGIVTVLAVLPLVMAGFVVGYGVGAGGDRVGDAVGRTWEDGDGLVDHAPLAASFTATEVAEPAPESPAVLPVGYSADLGIAVTHLQFAVDESTVRPDHTAELRLPVTVPPDSEDMTLEVASVYPVRCLCDLTAATAPPYGRVWDVVEVDAGATEVVLDVTGAITAPGRYGFAVTTPDRDAYLELEGAEYGAGPSLRTISVVPPAYPAPPTAPLPPLDPSADPSAGPTAPGTPSPTPTAEDPTSDPTDTPAPSSTAPSQTAEDPTSDLPGTLDAPSPSPSQTTEDPTNGSTSDPSSPAPSTTDLPGTPGPGLDTDPAASPDASAAPGPPTDPSPPAGGPSEEPATWPEAGGSSENQLSTCRTGEKLIPSCGALVGVAPAAHTSREKERAILEFEERVQHTQQIYHAYERGDRRLFPTEEQIALTEDPERPRTLFINWKPRMAEWGAIAAGDPETDAFLDRLAEHIKEHFDKPFFFTVHHEPENDVDPQEGSDMEASDYAAMYRYVVERLRGAGVDNLVTVMNYMGYLKWVEMPWHDELYPGSDVVDWIGLSGYGQSLHDDGHSDFGEIVDQTKRRISWPGFYHWVAREHPDKPMMLAEWGVFHEEEYPGHQEAVFQAARYQMAHYPRLKAIVYFESPNAEGRNSEVHRDEATLEAFRELMRSPYFDVRLELDGT